MVIPLLLLLLFLRRYYAYPLPSKAVLMARGIRKSADAVKTQRREASRAEVPLPDEIKQAVTLVFDTISKHSQSLGHSVPDSLHGIGNELNKGLTKRESVFDSTSALLHAVSKAVTHGCSEYKVHT